MTAGLHTHSREAYRSERQRLTGRRLQVYEFVRQHPNVTDRQVKDGLGFADMNAVRPRITELCNPPWNLLEECGEARDRVTGKRVRTVRERVDEPQQCWLFEGVA